MTLLRAISIRTPAAHILRWVAGGLLYGFLEILHHGHTHWTMILLAALLSIPLDIANNRIPWEMPLLLQALLGGLVVTGAELASGLVLNVWMGLSIWDYSGMPGNLWGQITPQYSAVWVLLSGVAIVLFDWIDYWIGGGKQPHYRMI